MSNSQSKTWFRFAWHPSEEELLLFLDGEAGERQAAKVRRHLEQCWPCRNRRDKFDAAITALVDYCATDTAQSRMLPPRASLQFTERLRHAAAQGEVRPGTHWMMDWRWADRRIALGATAALLLLIAAGLIFWRAERPVTAQELLRRAAQSETLALQQQRVPVVYRKLQVKRTGAREFVEWESWATADRQQFRQRFAPQSDARLLLAELEEVLRQNHLDAQHPLSAAAFAVWRNGIRAQAETVAESNDSLTLTTRVAEPHAPNTIREAALLVRKSDWHTVALQLRVQGEGEIRSYELREAAYEILPQQALPVLAEAASTSAALARNSPTPMPSPLPTATPTASVPVAPAAPASAALEVEMLERLNQANALLGEQLNLTRTAEGKLRIEGIVETDVRKGELLRALQAVADNPAVSIDLSTVAEAQARQAQTSPPRNVIIQDAQVTQATIPVEAELRNYFTARGFSSERLEQEIQQFSAQICGRSSRASSHAHALKQIAARFTPEQLQTLEQATRERWRALLRQHANGYQRELQQLRQQLQPIFPAAATRNAMEGTVASAEELLRAINQLFQLAATNDPALCQSFSVSTEATTAAVKRAEFWRAISKAENLATQIANWQ